MQEKEVSQYQKMTETPVSRLIITLGIPTTVSMLVTNIYNMVDTYFVGRIGTSASGAVGVVFGLMAVIQAIGFMFGHGSGSIIARKLGEKNVDIASKFASTSFFYSFGIGILLTLLGLIFINPFMRLLGSTETILPYARMYGLFILLAAPWMASSCVLNNILRYEGQAFFAMIGLTSGAVLNIAGDWILMTKMHMGIEGAGISTALSQVVSFFILLAAFLRGKTQSKIAFRLISREFQDVFLIMKTGLPSLMRQGLSSVSIMILNSQAAAYGDAAVAAMTIVNRICYFIFAVALGIGQGFQPVSAFNYGAGKYSRVRQGFIFTVTAGEVCLGCMAVFGMLLSSRLVGFFRNDPAVIEIGTFALRIQLMALFFMPLAICGNMMFQSIGKNVIATFLSALRSGLCFIPIILILSRLMGLRGVEISQTLSDTLTFFVSIPFVIHFFRFLPKDKEEDRVIQ
ncbi:MATE family efflux transporter [Aminipila luticellarii]